MSVDKLDVQQIEDIYRACYQDLTNFLTSKERDLVLVEDLIQDAFIKLHVSLAKGKQIYNPKSWLIRVLHNLWIDHYRKLNTTSYANLDHVPATQGHSAHGPEDCLVGIIANLPKKYKKAVYHVDIKGMKQQSAADKLGLSLPTLKSHVQRGRKLVIKGYVDCCDYEINDQGKLEGETKDWEECKVCSATI